MSTKIDYRKYMNFQNSIYKSKDEDINDVIISEIFRICNSGGSEEEIKDRLFYQIMSHFIGCHNDYVHVRKIIDQYFKEEFEIASRSVIDGGNYGWGMMFGEMMMKLRERLDLTEE